MRARALRSKCPIAGGLDILGDKWTLIVIRDLFRGKKKFSEFMSSPESIKTNILTDRLKWLEENEIIEKEPYEMKPTRYNYILTRKGKDLSAGPQGTCSLGRGAYFRDGKGIRRLRPGEFEKITKSNHVRKRRVWALGKRCQ